MRISPLHNKRRVQVHLLSKCANAYALPLELRVLHTRQGYLGGLLNCNKRPRLVMRAPFLTLSKWPRHYRTFFSWNPLKCGTILGLNPILSFPLLPLLPIPSSFRLLYALPWVCSNSSSKFVPCSMLAVGAYLLSLSLKVFPLWMRVFHFGSKQTPEHSRVELFKRNVTFFFRAPVIRTFAKNWDSSGGALISEIGTEKF